MTDPDRSVASRRGATQPGGGQSGNAQLGAIQPKATQFGDTRPGAAQPVARQPGNVQPRTTRLETLLALVLLTTATVASGAPALGSATPATPAAPAAARLIDLRRIEPIHGDAAAGAQKAAACLACHGANGVSVAPSFPRLAGQRPDYLYHRLRSFKQAGPKDPYYSKSPMPAMVATLSDEDMRDLATYYAAQAPQADGSGAPAAETDRGEAIYREGDPSRGVPPCRGCHGADARGLSTRAHQYAAYPSLRGQYAPYLIARLTSFREGLPRDSTNDLIMGGVAGTLDDESIRALAAWLASMTPAASW